MHWLSYPSASNRKRKPFVNTTENSLCSNLNCHQLTITLQSTTPSVVFAQASCTIIAIGICPSTYRNFYQLFEKYARSEELHQRKVESQRKPKDPPQSSRTWVRPAQSDSDRDNHNQQQVHTIANQHPVGEPICRQEYPPQGCDNGARGRGRGRAQQPRQFYCLFHGKNCAHPTRDCPETKATKDRMSRAQPADNQWVVAHTYHHEQQYHNEQIQHQPNHAYQHHQEVQVLPPPPLHHPNPPHHTPHRKHPNKKTSLSHHITESST
jgi:hypothetical protein